MRRRDTLLALLALGVMPLAAVAQQQGKVWRVGFLSQRHIPFIDSDPYYGPLRQELRALGYVEGKNLVIEWRSAEGKAERLAELAAELVRLKVDAIVTAGTPTTLAAQKATSTIPIVMTNVGDPVERGLIKSLARPGGNLTGHSNIVTQMGPKLLEMVRGLMPTLSRVGVLVNPSNLGQTVFLKRTQAAAQSLGVKVLALEAQTPQEIEKAFTLMAREKSDALIVGQEPLFFQQRHQIAEMAAKNRLPSISGFREFAESGGLMSYGASIGEGIRRAADYLDRIFKGAKPGELPVEQPIIFEMVINLKTAKALGLSLPPALLQRADEVIQ